MFGECGILASFVMNWPKLWALHGAARLAISRMPAAALSPMARTWVSPNAVNAS